MQTLHWKCLARHPTSPWAWPVPTERPTPFLPHHMEAFDEAILSARLLTRLEGIIPALESSHALGALEKMDFHPTNIVVLTVSGRGDKDIETYLTYGKWREKLLWCKDTGICRLCIIFFNQGARLLWFHIHLDCSLFHKHVDSLPNVPIKYTIW